MNNTPLIYCKHCGTETDNDSTNMCDRCCELDRLIRVDVKLAKRILSSINYEFEQEKLQSSYGLLKDNIDMNLMYSLRDIRRE